MEPKKDWVFEYALKHRGMHLDFVRLRCGKEKTFLEGVEAISGDEVQLETLDALKPATIRPTEGGEYLYLLMPVRVS